MAIRSLIALAILIAAAVSIGGCNTDSSMSNTVKPNPAMANRYKQGGGEIPTAPKGDATAPK